MGARDMHDILFKNSTSQDHTRRDILLAEAYDQQGVMTRTLKHFIYLVKDHALLNNPGKLNKWLQKYTKNGPKLKNLSVLKSYNSKSGEEKFEVQIAGNLYILREQDIFNVDFTQIFKINRKGDQLKHLSH
ncbi:MAG: hypothetical protein JW869_04740 [Candidatus Omnitrophica bacterium]|nr:hypothetical protein [Candidatus Omnitrophota bacterium]